MDIHPHPSPDLVVFDLDLTLWDCGGCWCDCLTPPFACDEGGVVTDHWGARVRLYQDVPDILDWLEGEGVETALASRTNEPGWAGELLDLLGVRGRFGYEEIYPGEKTAHFASLQGRTGFPYEAMVFYDDERRNIEAVSRLGVTSIFVTRGLDWKTFRQGVTVDEGAAG